MKNFIKKKTTWVVAFLFVASLCFYATGENFRDRVQTHIHTAIFHNKGPRPAETLNRDAPTTKYKGKIYDCCIFFNELTLLQIRLEELYDHVDHFVIVESEETHRGVPKPLNFLVHQHLFAKYLDKIIYVPIERISVGNSPFSFAREIFQRDQIMRGLTQCKEEDIIFISDVDEMPAGADIPLLVNRLLQCKVPLMFCGQKLYRYFLNRWDRANTPWPGTAIMTYGFLRKHFPQYTRRRREWKDFPLIESGWHFTAMGGVKKVIEKFQSVTLHRGDSEERLTNADRILQEAAGQVLVKIDETFPRYVQNNQGLLKENDFIDSLEN